MRKALRYKDNRGYWDDRWANSGSDSDAFESLDIYPIKYAEMVKPRNGEKAVELGCGLGRVVKHYHRQGLDITGIERSTVAVERMKQDDSGLKVSEDDVTALGFDDEAFDVVMAFGLYHNLEEGLDQALSETARCLRVGGRFVISTRPDNIEMRLNERYWRWRNRVASGGGEFFHKWLIGEAEFRKMLAGHGLVTDSIHRARNVSIFWRLPLLRASSRGESENRSAGYRLNVLGRMIDGLFTGLFPASFCNVLVYVGHKE